MFRLLFAMIFIAACVAPEDTNKTLWIGPELVDCIGVAPMQCMQVKETQEGDWTLFYDRIEGFDYESGYEYKVTVHVESMDDTPADVSKLKYTLVEVLEKNKVEMEPEASPSRPDIYEHTWSLKSYTEGDSTTTLGEDQQVTLLFNKEEEQAGGVSGCNSYSGKVAIDGTNIQFGPLASTKKMCADEEIMKLETEYLRLLGIAESISPDRSRYLTLNCKGGQQLRFLPAAAGDQAEM